MIEARWQALCDAIDYKLYSDKKHADAAADGAPRAEERKRATPG